VAPSSARSEIRAALLAGATAIDGGVFGDLAAGGNARVSVPVDGKLVAKMWRKEQIKRTRLPDGRRSSKGRGPATARR
jgi:hypothetical protein